MNPEQSLRACEASLLVGALGLDQDAVGQALLSQPLVGGWILGWALGSPESGLLAGAVFQFLCLTELRVGASVPIDAVLSGLILTAAFVILPRPGGWSDQALLGLLLLGFFPLALLARTLEVAVCRANRFWSRLAEDLVGRGRMRLAQGAAVGGILFFYLKGTLLAAAALGALVLWGGAGLERAAAAAPVLALFARCVPLIGLAALVAQRRRPGWPLTVATGLGAGFIAARGLA